MQRQVQLSREVAQRIVDRIASGLDKGVSVTATTAHVLASTRPSLIGAHHRLAAQVIATGTQLDCADGPTGEISLPLVYADHTIGALILDDASEHGREMARIAKTLAELIVHQSAVIEQLPHQRWVRNKFISDLLRGRLQADTETAAQEAALLGIDLSVPRIVAVVNVAPILNQPQPEMLASALPEIAHTLHVEQRHSYLLEAARRVIRSHEADVYSFIDDHLIVLLATVAQTDTDERRHDLARELQCFLDGLAREFGCAFSAGIGRYYPGVPALANSFGDAYCALQTGVALRGPGQVFLLEELGLASFICSEDQALKIEVARRLIDPLSADPELMSTLDAFLRANLSPSRTAEALHIHRHTLAYRLDKITRLTGLDARQFDAAAQLYAALVLWKIDGHHANSLG